MYEYERLTSGAGAPFKKGETIPPTTYVEYMRDFAKWAVKSCDAMGVPRYEEAVDILSAGDDQLLLWQQELRFTYAELSQYIEAMRDTVYEHIRYQYRLRKMAEATREISASS